MIGVNTVRLWLERWDELAYGGARVNYDEPSNCAPKEYDGISVSRLRIIELKQAIKSLPTDQRNVIICRYIRQFSQGETLHILGLDRSTYRKLCDDAVNNIWRYLAFPNTPAIPPPLEKSEKQNTYTTPYVTSGRNPTNGK